ncbi:MAG: ATP-binding cassette domain-containing protein, partial [Pasteurellaceae bacterium]|nr:ATP-binding cassette domain-containing protein [Pasteurellaceae bacterium]
MSLSVENLQLAYQDKTIIHNLSLSLPKNQVIALLGPNGCGKSTLLKSLARLLKPKSGKVRFENQDIWDLPVKSYAQQLAFLPQQHIVPEGIKVRELVAYGRSPYLNLWG